MPEPFFEEPAGSSEAAGNLQGFGRLEQIALFRQDAIFLEELSAVGVAACGPKAPPLERMGPEGLVGLEQLEASPGPPADQVEGTKRVGILEREPGFSRPEERTKLIDGWVALEGGPAENDRAERVAAGPAGRSS